MFWISFVIFAFLNGDLQTYTRVETSIGNLWIPITEYEQLTNKHMVIHSTPLPIILKKKSYSDCDLCCVDR